MKWTYSIKQKYRAAVALAFTFILVFANNWLEKRNVSELGDSFSSVYEDRLLAANYIYELSDLLHQKEDLIEGLGQQKNTKAFYLELRQNKEQIRTTIAKYEKTKFTESERVGLLEVRKNLAEIERIEASLKKEELLSLSDKVSKPIWGKLFADTYRGLQALSRIQVEEGKALKDRSITIVAGSEIASQMEVIVLLGIAIFIQALIFAKKTLTPKVPQDPSLN